MAVFVDNDGIFDNIIWQIISIKCNHKIENVIL